MGPAVLYKPLAFQIAMLFLAYQHQDAQKYRPGRLLPGHIHKVADMCVTRDAVNSINEIWSSHGEYQTYGLPGCDTVHNGRPTVRTNTLPPPDTCLPHYDTISQDTVSFWKTNVSFVEKTIQPVGRNSKKFLLIIKPTRSTNVIQVCWQLARRLSANLYDTYHCCVYSEKLLMMDRGTVRNM